MKIHLVTNLFAPDELAGAALYTDLAIFFKAQAHDVRVTTTFPYYPAWSLRPGDRGVPIREENHQGILVRRISMHVPGRPTGLSRLLSDASFLLSLWRRGRFPNWKPDVIITALPMFSQCLVQRLWGGHRIPRLIIVQDFVVAAAVELDILKFPGLIWLFDWLERYALRSARTLSTISPLMLENLRRRVGQDRRTLMIPNWIHGSLETEINRQAALCQKRAANLLFYSGNVGIKQGLPDFLETFWQARSEWRLKIHGGGADLDRLRSLVNWGSGVEMGAVLEEPQYIAALQTASACLITQRPGVGANFLPSKLLPALASGTPVLAVCDLHSPLGREVTEGGFGVVLAPGDVAALKAVLQEWRRSPTCMVKMGQNARARARLYSRDRILMIYEEELKKLVA